MTVESCFVSILTELSYQYFVTIVKVCLLMVWNKHILLGFLLIAPVIIVGQFKFVVSAPFTFSIGLSNRTRRGILSVGASSL